MQAIFQYGYRDLKFESDQQLREAVIAWEIENRNDPDFSVHLVHAIQDCSEDMIRKIRANEETILTLRSIGVNAGSVVKEVAQQHAFLARFQGEDALDYYFSLARQPTVWATGAEVYALAHLLDLAVTIRRINGKVETKDGIIHPEGRRPITLCYVNGNHYELRVDASYPSAP
jgi:NADH dehydrogenase FAD-containing subunit